MRTSNYFLATLKESPADAQVISHQLMLRAGLIRRVAAGIYDWLPLGLKVLRKVENIIREEMNNAGAHEVLLPAIQPAELWQESGRWEKYGPELLRLKDRHQRDFCVGPTHEEIITTLVKNDIRSYRQLPLNLYQIQTKFRDEVRPRFGVMRGREFIMKDAYSFDVDDAAMAQSYDIMRTAYCAIFDRLGLRYRMVDADNGAIGGNASNEFHVLADSGEDAIAYSDGSDYAANVELAEAVCHEQLAAPTMTMSKQPTPNLRTIQDLVQQHNMPIDKTIKTLIVEGEDDGNAAGSKPLVALLVRGDHELNVIKAAKLPGVAAPVVMAQEPDIRAAIGAGPGSLGPVNLPIRCIVDRSVAVMSDFAAGANEDDQHYFGINWQRDVELGEVADIRNIKVGDASPDGQGTIDIVRGIEVGHIFQLGDQYSQAMNATVLDNNGKAVAMKMGCYGIGVTRVVAAAIEQNHDDKGIIWPSSIAPFDLAIVCIGHKRSSRVAEFVAALEQQLKAANIDALIDDRDERPGVMFADHELIGIPHRLTIGERGLDKGMVEYQHRGSAAQRELNATELLAELQQILSA